MRVSRNETATSGTIDPGSKERRLGRGWAVLLGRRTCRPLRPASGRQSGASSTPVTWGLTPNRASKPVQTQGLARVVTGTVTTLACERRAAETQGSAGSASPESHARAFRGERLCRPRRPAMHRRELRARQTAGTVRSSSCADDDARRLSCDADRCASRTRPIALDDGLRRRQATRVAEGTAALMLQRSLTLPSLVATLPGRSSAARTLRMPRAYPRKYRARPPERGGREGGFPGLRALFARAAGSPE